MKPEAEKRASGIALIGELPWGSHFCQFYRTKKDLLDILIPYFRAGLENNELCIWSTSRPISVADAKEALQRAVPDFERSVTKGQIDIIPYRRWQAAEKTAAGTLASRLDKAIAGGFDGLRLSCHAFPEKKGGKAFTCYGADAIDEHNVIATYQRIVLDAKGDPCDYVFLEVNEAFEKLTGLKGEKIIGKKVTE